MKIIISILLLISLTTLVAFDIDSYNELSFGMYSIDGENYYNLQEELFSDVTFNDSWTGGIELDFVASEEGFSEMNSNLYDRFRTYLNWNYNQTNFYTSFSNTLFDAAKTNDIVLAGLYDPIVKPVTKNNLVFSASQSLWNLTLEGAIRYRNLNYDYNVTEDVEQENDMFTDLTLTYDVTERFGVFSTLYYKDDLSDIPSSEIPEDYEVEDPNSYFDEFTVGGGLFWKQRFGMNHGFKISTAYLNRDGETIPEYLNHYFITDARYNFTFTPQLNGFLSCISRGSFSKEEKKFYRVSNLIRAQFKYSLMPFDSRAYIGIGAKYNPENETDRYYTELSYPVFNRITIKLADYYSPEYYNNIVTGIEFSYAKYNSFYLENTFSMVENDIVALDDYNELRFGTRISF